VTRVTYEGSAPSGLASVLGGLIEQNLSREPGRSRLMKPALVGIDAIGADVGVTLRISAGSLAISDGVVQDADIVVTADPDRLLALTAAPLRLGYPDPLTKAGRSVIADILRGTVRVRHMLRHPLMLRRLTLLLSVA
jgi:hypothetical protein